MYMTNEEIIVRTLSSVEYSTAKTAIKSFYRATTDERAGHRDSITALAKEYIGAAHSKKPPIVRHAVVTKDSPATREKSVSGTETLSSLACPKCGDLLEHSAVCGACDAGRAGYRHRYSCVCGVSFVTAEQL